MQEKKQFFFILLLVNFIMMCFFLYKGKAAILSFEAAFLASCLIIFSSFYSYQKNIFKTVKKNHTNKIKKLIFKKKTNKNIKIIKFYEINDDFKIRFKDRLKHLSWFFAIFKMLSYVFLVLLFFILNRHNLLNISAFLLGVTVMPVAIFIFMLWVRYVKS